MNGGPEHDETQPGATGEGDTLPADLDVTRASGGYVIPDTRRRRTAAFLYLAVAAGSVGASLQSGNEGLLAAAAFLGAVALYHLAAAWPRNVDETEALAAASRAVGFAIGHASAQLAWRGLRSRPVWRILLYSADEPPSKRGLVELDAVDGTVLGEYTEENPEDWSFGLGGDPADGATAG